MFPRRPSSPPIPPADRADLTPDEPLYVSATTRVFRGRATSTAQGIVCKAHLGGQATQRLLHERALLSRLAGIDGVVQLAAGLAQEPVLCMQDVGGVSLTSLLQGSACDMGLAVSLASQLARALSQVHRAGIVHRDINPANILVTQSFSAVLIDFDLALSPEPHTASPQDGIVGTLGYLAPEQTGRTAQRVDQRADLYALGATLYEMTTGRLPFEVQDTLDLIHHHLVLDPVPPAQVNPHVPQGLSAIVMRLLAKAPDLRYQSADGLLHDLVRFGQEHARGGDGVFTLAERDFPSRLEAPSQLVGRSAERQALRAALQQAMETPGRALLIEGAPGVGKGALINDLRPVMAAAGGWFVVGKADQYQRDAASTSIVVQAMRALGRLLLAQSKQQLELHRQRILDALGRNAALVTHLLPEFEMLLGAQPDVPEVDPRLAESRLMQTLLDLLGAVASQQQPLLLVLEDLQWAETASLLFFERVMHAPALQGVALIGSYRTMEQDTDAALAQALQRWRQQDDPPWHLQVQCLTPEGTAQLAGEVLRLDPDRARELGRAVGELTQGNPFDTLELLNVLRDDGVLSLGAQGWQWDADAIGRFVGRTNVVDLLAVRIGRLPQDSRRLLSFMGCLGGSMELALLQAACGLADHQLQEQLEAPLENGLLVPGADAGEAVAFRHDRVQQAVLDLMSQTQRQQVQREIAARLAAHRAFQHDAARQYLECFALLHDRHEQRQVASLFLDVALELSALANYALAERYLTAARQLLAASDVHGEACDPAIVRRVDEALYIASYSLGRLPEMDALWVLLQERATGPLDLVDAACLRMRSLDMRGQMADSLSLGIGLLNSLGVTVPQDFVDATASERLGALGDWVRVDARVAHVQREQITDRRLLAIARLLGRMSRSAYLKTDTTAVVWLLLECQRLWYEHGPCPDLVLALSRICLVLIREKQDYHTAYEASRHVVAVGQALGYEPQTSEARVVFASYASGWFEPLEAAYEHAVRAYQGVRVSGDVSYACYVERSSCLLLQQMAPTLEQCAASIDASIAMCLSVGNFHAEAFHFPERQVVRALRGMTRSLDSLDDGHFSEADYLAQKASMPLVSFNHHARRAHLAMLAGDAQRLNLHATALMASASGELDLDLYLPLALARAWEAQAQMKSGSPAADSEHLLRELESCRLWLEERARDQPYNFEHLLRLVEAEQAYAMGHTWKAAVAFDAAVSEAQTRQRPWHRALITERAGLFHVTAGLARIGRQLLGDALEHYRAWGASAKVRQMLQAHDFLGRAQAPQGPGSPVAPVLRTGISSGHPVRGISGDISSDAVDLMGVLRASQALSSETSVERLTARVTQVLSALSGATRVLVLTWREPQWWLLAPAPGEASIDVTQAARRGLLPLSVVTYADRTGEALVVHDAARDDRFARDPYFAQVPSCSLLVAPISSQGAARAMLVLESRVSREAFGVERLDAVMLIAGQLAVSLANAQLYESLEQRVQARTRELELTQSQLVTTARRAGKAEIANNVLHNVGNVLNSVNVSASVVRKAISESRALGLARAVALLNEHHEDLPEFMEKDPRGKALLPYLNEVVEALRREREAALQDLDRLSSSVEHITYVVANQQSHAGPSSVLEQADAGELMEEALRLSAQSLMRYRVAIGRRYAQVPQMTLDRQRVLQILVNLISNAAQAMQGLPEQARLLTLGVSMDGDELHLVVQDVGEGIEAQNLVRIFAHGFTTRKDGHGFGLHSCALAAMEMGGRLVVHSDGPGKGAAFTLALPLQRESAANAGALP